MAGGLGRPEARGGVLVVWEPARSAILRRRCGRRTPGTRRRRSWPCDRHLSRSSRCGLHELEHDGSRRVLARHSHGRADDRACVRAVSHELPTARKFGAAPPRPSCAEVPRRSRPRKTAALGAEACPPDRVRQAAPASDGRREDDLSANQRVSSDSRQIQLTRPTATRIGIRSTPSSSRWPGCGRSPTGPPDMAVKHARRAFPAPGLFSQTGMEPATRDSVQHTSTSRRKAASWGPRAHRECSRSLLLELSSRANTDYPLTLSKTYSVTLDSSRDCR